MLRLLWIAVFGLIVTLSAAGAYYVWFIDKEPVVLTVAAGEKGGDAHTLMTEVAAVLKRADSSVRLEVRNTNGASANLGLVASKTVDLATIASNMPSASDVDVVADLYADYFLLMARSDVAIYDLRDLLGKNIAIPPTGTSANKAFWAIMDHYRIQHGSFKAFPMAHKLAEEAFMDGKVDAIFLLSSVRNPLLLSFFLEAEERDFSMRFIEIDQAKAMTIKRPFLTAETLVKGAFNGSPTWPGSNIDTPTLHRLLVAHGTVPHDQVKELTRVLFENRLDLLVRMPLTASISSPRSDGVTSLPVHSGAEAYYNRDQPSFLQENAEPIALVITVLAMIVSALLALRKNLSARAKNRADVYNDVLLDINSRARDSRDVEALRNMRGELSDVLEKIVRALDTDQVTEEGFQSFSLLWSSVRDTVNERIHDFR